MWMKHGISEMTVKLLPRYENKFMFLSGDHRRIEN